MLYIFPHPDDESFGPARAISKQRRDGHEVHLLTLTRGGATKQRHQFGYSVEQMGEVRYREMLQVARVLGLNGMRILDLPDSGLKELDPRAIEEVIRQEITRLRPEVVVTYAVHGISGFHDHLVSHAVVKRVFVELRENQPYPRRLAFFTLTAEDAAKADWQRLSSSTAAEIDCVTRVDDSDIEKNRQALDCYESYRQTIVDSRIKEMLHRQVHFEIFQEDFQPPLGDLCERLP
jgi:LmbE family N-acetylglucosaminyl deacetylase